MYAVELQNTINKESETSERKANQFATKPMQCVYPSVTQFQVLLPRENTQQSVPTLPNWHQVGHYERVNMQQGNAVTQIADVNNSNSRAASVVAQSTNADAQGDDFYTTNRLEALDVLASAALSDSVLPPVEF